MKTRAKLLSERLELGDEISWAFDDGSVESFVVTKVDTWKDPYGNILVGIWGDHQLRGYAPQDAWGKSIFGTEREAFASAVAVF